MPGPLPNQQVTDRRCHSGMALRRGWAVGLAPSHKPPFLAQRFLSKWLAAPDLTGSFRDKDDAAPRQWRPWLVFGVDLIVAPLAAELSV